MRYCSTFVKILTTKDYTSSDGFLMKQAYAITAAVYAGASNVCIVEEKTTTWCCVLRTLQRESCWKWITHACSKTIFIFNYTNSISCWIRIGNGDATSNLLRRDGNDDTVESARSGTLYALLDNTRTRQTNRYSQCTCKSYFLIISRLLLTCMDKANINQLTSFAGVVGIAKN